MQEMTKVALDAMGGDNAPMAPVLGAIEAVKAWGEQIVLVGREDEIRAAAEAWCNSKK